MSQWLLASIVVGLEVAPWQSGHRVFVSRGQCGRVRIIGKNGATAILSRDEARRRLRLETRDGRPIVVRGQMKKEAIWQAKEAGRFNGVKRRILA